MLAGAYSRLEGRLDRIGDLFEGQYRTASRKGYRRITRYHLLEGATSQAWQAWCGFCRHVVHASCSGTTTMTGVVVPPIANAPSLGRMAYVSKQLMVGQAVKPGKECRPHQEPTWGDPKVCLEAIDYFKPTNSVSLKVGLSLAYPAPRSKDHKHFLSGCWFLTPVRFTMLGGEGDG